VPSEDPARVEADLIAAVKLESERRKMLVRSPGSGKGAEYRRKKDEGETAGNVLAAVLNALTAPQRRQQYPFAAMESQLTGVPLVTVLAGYREAAARSDDEVARLSAIERRGVLTIKAATTVAAKRAAAAAINWSWTA
jgi:hypothetical protein